MKILQRIKNKLPKKMRNVWWNQSVHMSDIKFPIVNWKEISYLNCEVGLIVPMKELPNGKYAYYEVVSIEYKRGGDWLYPSDSIECNMKFHSIDKKLTNKYK